MKFGKDGTNGQAEMKLKAPLIVRTAASAELAKPAQTAIIWSYELTVV
jgi:hypothetical protein